MKISSLIDRQFFYLDATDTVSYAAKKFAEKNFTSAPVLKGEKLVGVFSIYDAAAALSRGGGKRGKKAGPEKAGAALVGKCMKQKAFYIPEDAIMDDAVLALARHRSSCIPVADRKGRLSGVLWAKDVRNYMAGVQPGGMDGSGGAKEDAAQPSAASEAQEERAASQMPAEQQDANAEEAQAPAETPAAQEAAAVQAGKQKAQGGRKTIAEMLGFGKKKEPIAKAGQGQKKAAPQESKPAAPELATADSRGNTAIDQVLRFVEKKGIVSSSDVAREFKLPVSEIEQYAVSLEKHGILQIEYTMLGKMKLKKKE